MDKIYIISNEWTDSLKIIDDIIYRTNHKDYGTFIIEGNKLFINWNEWGEEIFLKKNDIYYKEDIEKFSLFIECRTCSDYFDINIDNNEIISRNYKLSGYFSFNDTNLEVMWNNLQKELFYPSRYGTKFISNNLISNFGNKNLGLIKNIAIIFPQFHEIPENNKFWGKGFTEWTLLKKTHRKVDNQSIKYPHDDIGFYNLKDSKHRSYMEKLANNHNIYGFCFYHYWFKDKKVMYEPAELMIKENNPNKPFMFCWANEQWTRKWDGGNNDILIDQDYSNDEGNIMHFNYLLDFFNHKNYIKIENKPVFIFYRIEGKFKYEIENIINLWNNLAKQNGFSGIYFMRFLGPFNNNVEIDGIEGFINFQPGYIAQKYYNDIKSYSRDRIFKNNEFNEESYLSKNLDIKDHVDNKIIANPKDHYNMIKGTLEEKVRTSKFFVFNGKESFNKIISDEKMHEEQHLGIFTGWNNAPRRNYVSKNYSQYPHYYNNITLDDFEDSYGKLLNKISKKSNKKIDFLFLSAWNEWNEQAILEPNDIDGYGYLNAIKNQYNNFYNIKDEKNILIISHRGGGTEKYSNDLIKLYKNYNFTFFKDYNRSINYNILYKGIDLIHINSFLFNDIINDYIYFFNNNLQNVKKIITIHDYQWLIPENPNVFSYNFNNENIKEVNKLNTLYLFSICEKIIFPSYNILDNYDRICNIKDKYYSKIIVTDHPDIMINYDCINIKFIDDVINIAFLGYFCDYKGSDLFRLLLYTNRYIGNYKIIYHVFGNISDDERSKILIDDQIIYHNNYKDENIIEILNKNKIHGITHLSIFEESYCYALSYSINSGIPLFYINHGSLSERLSDNDRFYPTNLDDMNENYIQFLNYIISNNGVTNNIQKISKIQNKKWYIENY